MKSNVIKSSLSCVLKNAGFRRKGNNWFWETEDAVVVVNLQKSNFGEQYYVNLAVWLRALGDASEPKEQLCHVRLRSTALDAERQKYWEDKVFNLEYPLPDEERDALSRSFMESNALPFLRAAASLDGLRNLQGEGRLKGAAVMAKAQSLIGG